jgi:chemotaxis protein CheY-P-specific phosphatase CheC
MTFEELDVFTKDLKELLKKYRTLNEDLGVVKKVLEEQFNRDVEYDNYDDESNDKMSNIDYDMDMRNDEITKSQLKDMINHYSEISCDGINQFNELEMYGIVPEWNIIYCLYYKGKSRSELFKKYKSM